MEKSQEKKRAVALLSGGLDSAVAAALVQKRGYTLYALTVDYGQRHKTEIKRARRIAKALGAKEHKVIKLDLRAFGGSALTADIPVPKKRRLKTDSHIDIPVTYVPARNTIFLALALAWAETLAADAVVIGVNAVDYSGYPDCRPEFIRAFQKLAQLATRTGVSGHKIALLTPIIRFSKAEIIKTGHKLGVNFTLTLSCYDPDPQGRACGECDSCRIRRQGFAAAGLSDPTTYKKSI